MKLSICILSHHRRDLLQAVIASLLHTVTVEDFELNILEHSGSVGTGWNNLVYQASGEYLLMTQDDWFFIEKWDWVQDAIKMLESDEKIGIVRLRKDGDGQVAEKVTEEIEGGVLVDCLRGGFTLNAHIARKDTLLKLGKALTKKEKGIAEVDLRLKYANFQFKTAKLGNAAHGVCIHIGRGRRVLGEET